MSQEDCTVDRAVGHNVLFVHISQHIVNGVALGFSKYDFDIESR